MADSGVALRGEGRDDPAGAGAVHLPHHEVGLAEDVAQPPGVALPVVAIHRHRHRQQLEDVWGGRGRDRRGTDGRMDVEKDEWAEGLDGLTREGFICMSLGTRMTVVYLTHGDQLDKRPVMSHRERHCSQLVITAVWLIQDAKHHIYSDKQSVPDKTRLMR